MTEVSINPEYLPKRKKTVTYGYDALGRIILETHVSEEVPTPEKVVDRVLSVRSVPHEEVDALIDAGYQPESYFAKAVIMVLTESANERVMEKVKESLG